MTSPVSHATFYRPEIDGLRSVAVLPVMLFHAGFVFFSGGFVGVDIFFVISGYLITSILAKELSEGRFSIINFYERRARRILPALFFVMAVTLPFALWWMLDADLSNLGRSMVSVGLFASNLFFWKNTTYFDPASGEQPLLHTWSLAVEEQYYIFFPILLFVLWKLRRRYVALLLVAATAGSLGLAQWASFYHPETNFYLLPTRAWELLCGSLAALALIGRRGVGSLPIISLRADAALAVIGLAMIVYSVLAFDENIPFPSVYTLVPVLGTCLIILFATARCVAGNLLAWKPMVAVGLVSYSAYLWHQPMFALYRLAPFPWTQSVWIFLPLIAVVFVLAWFSWRYVERPFRQRDGFTRKQILSSSGVGLVALMAAGGAMAMHYHVTEVPNPNIAECSFAGQPKMVCKRIGSGPRQVVVFGDSHALPLMDAFVKNTDYTVTVASVIGCPPLIGLRRYDEGGDSGSCNEPGQILGYAQAVAALHPEKILLAGRWTLYLKGWQRKNVLQHRHHLLEFDDGDHSGSARGLSREALLTQGLQTTVQWFKAQVPGVQIFVLEQVPDLQMYGHVKTAAQALGMSIPRSVVDGWDEGAQQVLKDLAAQGQVTVVRTKPAFCDASQCVIGAGKQYYYFDDNHMSTAGARRLVGLLGSVLEPEEAAAPVDVATIPVVPKGS